MRNYKIYIPTISGKKTISCKNIVYVEQQNMFSRLFYEDDTNEDVLLSISELEHLLKKHGFFRFNTIHLVNLRFIQVVFPSDASKVMLENGKEIYVSNDRKEDLFESLKSVFELHEIV